jgi:hypothetical protein
MPTSRPKTEINLITTKSLAEELGLSDRAVRKRIESLGIRPQQIGGVILLSPAEAEKVRAAKSKPGPSPRAKSKELTIKLSKN